jgi:hypothetical protein
MKKIIIWAVIILVIIAGAYLYDVLKQQGPGIIPQPVGCTAEAKICPDGSAVGRSGPKCEFAACPGSTTSTQ